MSRCSLSQRRLARCRTERLEQRHLLSATGLLSTAGFATQIIGMPEGGSIPYGSFRLFDGPAISAHGHAGSRAGTTGSNPSQTSVEFSAQQTPIGQTAGEFRIEIIEGADVPDGAMAAARRAARQWEQVLTDPITITIDLSFLDLGEDGPLGHAFSTSLIASYDTVRDALVRDADANDEVLRHLPTRAEFLAEVPSGFGFDGSVRANKAVLKAMGYSTIDSFVDMTDGQIEFNTFFSFDFDNRDGITTNTFDFESVMVHEIGHVLGFVSNVDVIESFLEQGLTTEGGPTVWDLFRFADGLSTDPEWTTASANPYEEFRSFPRTLVPGVESITDDLVNEFRVSTGAELGDGFQASHFKNDDLTGVYIGIMDPTFPPNSVALPTRADYRVLDLIGYDVESFVLPDLRGETFSITPGGTVFGGQSLTANVSIANLGGIDTRSFKVRFYISSDGVITNGDALIGQFTFDGIDAGQSSGIHQVELQLPGPGTSFWGGNGTYRIGMIIDVDDEAFEAIESNNANAGLGMDSQQVTVQVSPPAADLVGSQFDVLPGISPENLSAGQRIPIAFAVTNLGVGNAAESTVRFYLSASSTIDAATGFLLGQLQIAALAPGATTGTLSGQLVLPSSLHPIFDGGAGEYFIGMIVDATNVVPEANEANNRNRGQDLDRDAVSVVLDRARPDLLGDFFDARPEPLTSGDSLTAQFSVKNAGGVNASRFRVNFYLSQDATISTSDHLLGQRTIDGLLPGATTGVINQALALPPGEAAFWAASGTYYIGMLVDVDNQIAEGPEANNGNLGEGIDLDGVSITVAPAPADLLGESFDVVPTEVESGGIVDAKFQIRNQGPAAAGSFLVRFYLSTNSLVSATDTLLAERVIAGLGVNASTGLLTESLQLPPSISGNPSYIGLIIDPLDDVLETNETNNRNRGLGLDLDVLSIKAPPVDPPIDTENDIVAANVWIGAYSQSNASFAVQFPGDSQQPNMNWNMGIPGWVTISGDWDGDGVETVGLYNPVTATFFLSNSLGAAQADITPFNYGMPGWVPIAGDWNGDGIHTIGVYNPNTAEFFLRNSNTSGNADVPSFNYGLPQWVPLAGDWDGDGIDTIGAYQSQTAQFFLRNSNSVGMADVPSFNYGLPGWLPVVGDWDNDERDTIGVYNPLTATLHLRNSNDSGVADLEPLAVGAAYGLPVAGKIQPAPFAMSLSSDGQSRLASGATPGVVRGSGSGVSSGAATQHAVDPVAVDFILSVWDE